MSLQEGQIIGEESLQPDAGSVFDDDAQRSRILIPGWLRIVWQNRKARFGLILLGVFAFFAIFAPWLVPYDPRDNDYMPFQSPNSDHWLGTTQAGQDIFSQLIWGARTSIIVGILAGLGGSQ